MGDSIREIAEQVEKEVDSEQPSELSPEKEVNTEETNKLQELDNDTEFQEAQKELEKETGKKLSFGQTKRFRQVYWAKKESDRLLSEKEKELAELRNKELSDDEIIAEIKKRNLVHGDTPETPEVSDEFDFNKIMMDATPEQREWLNIIDKISESKIRIIENKLKRYEDKFGSIETSEKVKELAKDEADAKKYVTDKGLNWETDVMPETIKLAKELQKSLPQGVSLADAGWTPTKLSKLVISDKAFELGKKSVAKKTEELNQSKRKANVETDTVSVEESSKLGKDASLRDILKEEAERAGVFRFD